MKKYNYKIGFVCFIVFGLLSNSCSELDLVQEDAASSGNWYQTKEQFRQSLNEGYREVFWPIDEVHEGMDDDWQYRDELDAIKAGTLSSEYSKSNDKWSDLYKGIARMLSIINQLEGQKVLNQEDQKQMLAEANFLRASYWSYLISHYGDVPF